MKSGFKFVVTSGQGIAVERKRLRLMVACLAVSLALPSVVSAETRHRFWAGEDRTGWTTAEGDCWNSKGGATDLSPCAAAKPEIMESRTIELVNDEFDFDSAAIKPDMAVALDDVARAVRQSRGDELLTIVGHTDGVGSQAYNYRLGLRRADSTKAYLSGVGIPVSRMVTRSAGKLEPIATNETEAGRARNRRIEIRTEVYSQDGRPVEVDIQ